MKGAWIVFVKEVRDALRDRRTLMAVVLSSVVMGPLLLFGLSVLVAGSEERAESREVMVAGIEHAPSLRNFLERQTLQIKAAPADYERQLVERRLADPVIVIGPDFEAALARGERPLLEVVTSSANTRAAVGVRRLQRALHAFNQESRDAAPDLPRRRAGRAGVGADPGARPGRSAGARRAADRHRAVLRADGRAVRGAQCGAGHHGRRARARLAGAAADDAGVARWRWWSASGARWPASAC